MENTYLEFTQDKVQSWLIKKYSFEFCILFELKEIKEETLV